MITGQENRERMNSTLRYIDDFKKPSDIDYTNAFSRAFDGGISNIGLKEGQYVSISTVILPDRAVKLVGNNSKINFTGDTELGVAFKKSGEFSEILIEGINFDTTKNHKVSNMLSKIFPRFGSFMFINSKWSNKGTIDIANFAKQGFSDAPIGVIIHHYTDGNVIQVDNVGQNNFILTLKNARNITRREDKNEDFCGSGHYIRLLQSVVKNGVEEVEELLRIDKDGNMVSSKSSQKFLTVKKEDGFWAYMFKPTANILNNIIGIVNQDDDLHIGIGRNTNGFNFFRFSNNNPSVFEIRTANDGRYGVLFESIGEKDHSVAFKQNGKTLMDLRTDTVDFNTITLTGLSVAPPPSKGKFYFNSNMNKLCFCEDGVNWRIVTTT